MRARVLLALSATLAVSACGSSASQPLDSGTAADGGGTADDGGGTAADGGGTAADGGGTAADGGGTAADGGGTAADGGGAATTDSGSALDGGDAGTGASDGGLPDAAGADSDAGAAACDELHRRCAHAFHFQGRVGDTEVEVRGSFPPAGALTGTCWGGAGTGDHPGVAMAPDGSGGFSATVAVPWNAQVQYKFFINGAEWLADPTNSHAPGENGNSVLDPATCPADYTCLGTDRTPITAAPGTWTWVDFPSAVCDDGSPTGIGINPTSSSTNLLVYFQGGGACWDAVTCLLLNTSTHGPFGAAQLDAAVGPFANGLFDRTQAANPARDFNYVFVPYCTGDLHAGDRVATYSSGGAPRAFYHLGRANLSAYLARLAATFPSPGKLVVAGSSAGGYATLLDYAAARTTWPAARSYLVDDSGPPLEGDAVSAQLRSGWYSAWDLGPLLDPLCPDCRQDLSGIVTALGARYPGDRMALLSSLQDQTISSYLGLTGPEFQTALLATAADVYDPSASARYFFVTGNTHVMLASPGSFSTGSVALPDWLAKMVGDDASWASVKP